MSGEVGCNGTIIKVTTLVNGKHPSTHNILFLVQGNAVIPVFFKYFYNDAADAESHHQGRSAFKQSVSGNHGIVFQGIIKEKRCAARALQKKKKEVVRNDIFINFIGNRDQRCGYREL